MRIYHIKHWLILSSAFLACSLALAQSWPPATVKIVVPYQAGAEPDVLARDLANALGKKTGKTFIVENRPGANAIIGTEAVVKSAGDGATLLLVDRLSVVTNPMLYNKMPYDWKQQLAPVTDIAAVRLFLTVGNTIPVKNWREFVDYARAHPGKITAGIPGNGHIIHIGMAMISQSEGFKLTYVPYKGLPAVLTGFMGGEVDVVLAGGLVTQQIVKTKPDLKVIAVGDTRRAKYMAEVPTVEEAGGKPGVIPSTVFSLFASAATPPEIVQQINTQFHSVIDQAFAKKYVERGLEIKTDSPSEMAMELKVEGDNYGRVFKDLGIRIE